MTIRYDAPQPKYNHPLGCFCFHCGRPILEANPTLKDCGEPYHWECYLKAHPPTHEHEGYGYYDDSKVSQSEDD